MKIFSIKFIIFLIFCCGFRRSSAETATAKIFEVKRYGARGNGIADDYKSIQNCIDAALKVKFAKIIFGPGTYKISKGLIAHYLYNDLEIIGVEKGHKFPTIVCSSPVSVLAIRGYLESNSIGTILIKTLNIKGKFGDFPYKISNPYVNQASWYYGVSITDKKKVILDRINVSNIYGQGIYISTTKQIGLQMTSRFQQVNVSNCNILNCWGYNPKYDNYGDGLYISNVASAEIKNNVIKNDFSQTKQLGRCGIVVEFMAENCVIINNEIFGYDRGIHVEADYGGHTLENNKIFGSDMGIVLFNQSIDGHNRPVRIIGNTISNKGLPKTNNLKRTRDIMSISDRSLFNIVAENGARVGSLIANNSFIIDGNFDYFSNAIVNIKADGLIIRDNKYVVIKPKLLHFPIKVFNYSDSFPKNDTFDGVSVIQLKKIHMKPNIQIERDNRLLGGTKVEIN